MKKILAIALLLTLFAGVAHADYLTGLGFVLAVEEVLEDTFGKGIDVEFRAEEVLPPTIVLITYHISESMAFLTYLRGDTNKLWVANQKDVISVLFGIRVMSITEDISPFVFIFKDLEDPDDVIGA